MAYTHHINIWIMKLVIIYEDVIHGTWPDKSFGEIFISSKWYCIVSDAVDAALKRACLTASEWVLISTSPSAAKAQQTRGHRAALPDCVQRLNIITTSTSIRRIRYNTLGERLIKIITIVYTLRIKAHNITGAAILPANIMD